MMKKKSAISPMTTHTGFTLVEMAMVLAIVALLLTGLIPTISGQVELRRISETKKQLDEIQQALIGFAIINGYFPCPATLTSNGLENRSAGICNGTDAANYNGYIPGATLGLSALDERGLVMDAWGNPVRYAITGWNKTTAPTQNDVFTTTNGMRTVGISGLNPGSFAYLLVCTTSTGIDTGTPGCGATGTSLTPSPGVPLIVFSTGGNGPSATGSDDQQNMANTRVFISHDPVQGGYDDIVTWTSPNMLINRLVSAGKLP